MKFPGALYAAMFCAVVVALPSLWSGFFFDDLVHIAILDGLPAPGSKWNLFAFAHGDANRMTPFIERGPYPWWTFPELKLTFFRPLSTALMNLDHAAFGHWAPGYHVHSILWYVALTVAVGLLLRRLLPTAVAAIAVLLFAIDSNHVTPVDWIANRNALVATVFTVFGLVAHIRYREERWRPGLPLSVAGFGFGLCGGETAVAMLAYVFAYELVGAQGSRKERALSLLPAALLGLAYVGVYKIWNFGAHGSAVYIDPTKAPVEFIVAAPGRFLALASSGFLHAPADFWLLLPQTRPALVIGGAAALVVTGFAVRSVWPSLEPETARSLRWLLVGAALSMVPVLATFPANRLLLVPSVGLAALFAALLMNARRWARGAAVVFVASYGLTLIAWPVQAWMMNFTTTFASKSAELAGLDDRTVANEQLIVLNAPDPIIGIYVPIFRAFEGRPMPYAWQIMTMSPVDLKFTRTAANAFELQFVGGRMLDTIFEQLVRSHSVPLRTDTDYVLSGAKVRVLEMEGTGPTRLLVTFDRSLEDSRYRLLEWREDTLKTFTPPRVGESVMMPSTPGPMSLARGAAKK